MEAWLERDLDAYLRLLPELLQEHTGKYVLIHAGKQVGTFETSSAALAEGYRLYKLDEPFFVKEVIAQPSMSSLEAACHS